MSKKGTGNQKRTKESKVEKIPADLLRREQVNTRHTEPVNARPIQKNRK